MKTISKTMALVLAGVIIGAILSLTQGHTASASPTYLGQLIVDDSKAVIGGVPVFSVSGPITAYGATVADSQSGAAGAAVTATLPGAIGKTTRILGFTVTAGSVVAAVGGTVTVGPLVGPKTFSYTAVISVATGEALTERFDVPIPASGTNQAITVSVPAIIGGSATSVNVWGDQV